MPLQCMSLIDKWAGKLFPALFTWTSEHTAGFSNTEVQEAVVILRSWEIQEKEEKKIIWKLCSEQEVLNRPIQQIIEESEGCQQALHVWTCCFYVPQNSQVLCSTTSTWSSGHVSLNLLFVSIVNSLRYLLWTLIPGTQRNTLRIGTSVLVVNEMK